MLVMYYRDHTSYVPKKLRNHNPYLQHLFSHEVHFVHHQHKQKYYVREHTYKFLLLDYYYKEICANAHRGDYEISYKVDTLYEETRKKVANFINAKREEIVFTSGATESLNMIANKCKLFINTFTS